MMGFLRSQKMLAGLLTGVAVAATAVTGASAAAATAPAAPASSAHAAQVPRVAVAQSAVITPHAASLTARACWNDVYAVNIMPADLPVSANQPIAVSASEQDAQGNEFIGRADITVENVAVTNGRVTAVVNIAWDSGLTVCLHYVG